MPASTLRPIVLFACAVSIACLGAAVGLGCDNEAPVSPPPAAPVLPTPTPVEVPADDAPIAPPEGIAPDALAHPAPARPPVEPGDAFFGEPDAPRLEALATGDIVEIEKGRGGRSLAFKLTLSDGTRGYFKPEQTFSAAHWYSELASYHLDRMLGIGRVAPVVARRLAWEPLREVADGDSRIGEVIVSEDGTVRGAFVYWIDGGLARLQPGDGWDAWIRLEGPLSLTPFVRPRQYRAAAQREDSADTDRDTEEATRTGTPAGEPDTADRAAELSDMILFDYLTANVDRWGGNFTNVRTLGSAPGGPLVYLDNGAGFSPGRQRFELIDARLHSVQRFRRSTIDAIRALDLERFAARLEREPLGPILDDAQLEGLAIRREAILEHVAAMEERFGAAAIPW